MATSFEGKVPRPDQIPLVDKEFIDCLLKIDSKLQGSGVKWSVGGDLGELLRGVLVKPDCVEILTSKDGAVKIYDLMREFEPTEVTAIERRLTRDAIIGEEKNPVHIRSYCSEFSIGKTRVLINGDWEYKIDDSEWGGVLKFEPEYVFVVGYKMGVIPVTLKGEFYLKLGWDDRIELVNNAIAKAQTRHDNETPMDAIGAENRVAGGADVTYYVDAPEN